MLPQVNAILVSIKPPGFTEDFDRDAGAAGATKLANNMPVDAYYIESIRTVYSQSDGALRKTRDIQLIIPADVPLAAGQRIATGDLVTFTYQGVTHTRRIQDYVDKFLQGIPNLTVRMHLDAAAVEVTADSDATASQN